MDTVLIIGAIAGIFTIVIGILRGRRNRREIPAEVMARLKKENTSWLVLLITLLSGVAYMVVNLVLNELIEGDDPFTTGKILVNLIAFGTMYGIWMVFLFRRSKKLGVPPQCLKVTKRSMLLSGLGLVVTYFCILSLLH